MFLLFFLSLPLPFYLSLSLSFLLVLRDFLQFLLLSLVFAVRSSPLAYQAPCTAARRAVPCRAVPCRVVKYRTVSRSNRSMKLLNSTHIPNYNTLCSICMNALNACMLVTASAIRRYSLVALKAPRNSWSVCVCVWLCVAQSDSSRHRAIIACTLSKTSMCMVSTVVLYVHMYVCMHMYVSLLHMYTVQLHPLRRDVVYLLFVFH